MGTFDDITVEFDFEDTVKNFILPTIAETPTSSFGLGSFGRIDPKLRTVVCRHWLQGLCQKGDNCDYLHKLDKSKMPPCKHGKQCKIKNCPLKHVDEEERPECLFFKQGFCFKGPQCTFRHLKRPPDDCPKKANFDDFMASGNQNVPLSKKRKTHQPNQYYKITLCKHWLEHGLCPYGEECHYAHGEAELRGFSGAEDLDDIEVLDQTRNRMDQPLVLPFNINSKAAYFLLHSPDLRSLSVSKKRGVWSVSTKMAIEINNALKSGEIVVIFFVVKAWKGIYGIARLEGNNFIPTMSMRYSYLSPEFPINWMKMLRISLKLVAQLRMSAGMSIGRTTLDGRIDKSAGYEILLIALRKPEWIWMKDVPSLTMKPDAEAPPSYPPLPPDILFPPDWGNVGGMSGTGKKDSSGSGAMSINIAQGDNSITSSTSNSMTGTNRISVLPSSQSDYYTGDLCGFVLPIVSQELPSIVMSGRVYFQREIQDSAGKDIGPGVPIFLRVSARSLGPLHTVGDVVYGLFEAISSVVWDNDGRGAIRIRSVLESPPLAGRDVEMSNLFPTPPHIPLPGQLNLWQTKQLANIFAIRSGAISIPSKPDMNISNISGLNRMQHNTSGMTTSGGGPLPPQHQTQTNFKPKFKNIENIPIGVPILSDGGYTLRRKLLGNQASNVLAIVNEIANPQTLQIRLRGVGSGFKEGPQHTELNEPLHFVVSADDENILQAAIAKVSDLVYKARRSESG